MPPLRTDDGPRKLRAVWLGPAGATLPFEWTYVQWVVTLLTVPAASAAAWGVVTLIGLPAWVGVIAAIYGGVAGLYLSVKAMRGVTFDEPLKHKVATVRAEFGRRNRKPAARAETWTFPRITITDLSPHALQLDSPERTTDV